MKKIAMVFSLAVLVCMAARSATAQTLESITKTQSGRPMRASSGNYYNNNDNLQFAPGETHTLARLKGPGKITHMWFTPQSRNIRHPRALVIRIYWDGAKVPSVEVPLGDFFAVGNGMQAEVKSLPVNVCSHGRGYNCYWRMPFGKEAVITMTNESPDEAASSYFQIDWVKYDEVPKDLMYFHARYHQEFPPEMGKPYTLFVGKGRGQYVGTVISSQNGIGHWFGEGDDLFYVDGEKEPSIVGTGTEDYINEAWNMRVQSGLFTGCTVFEPRAPDARVSAYRWHIPDPISFTKSLRAEIERRGFLMNEHGDVVSQSATRPDFWSTVSFWYQDTIAEPWCEFPPYKDRVNPEIVLHLESRKVVKSIKHSPGIELQILPYNRATYTKPWFRVKNDRPGEWIEIPFTIKEKGRYSMSLFQLLREDNGVWKVFIDGKTLPEVGESHIAGGYRVSLVNQIPKDQVNQTLDFFNIFRFNEHEDVIYGQRREQKIGLFDFEPGVHTLRLVCVGSNPASFDHETGKLRYNMTADVLSLRKIPFENMDEWVKKAIEQEKLRPQMPNPK